MPLSLTFICHLLRLLFCLFYFLSFFFKTLMALLPSIKFHYHVLFKLCVCDLITMLDIHSEVRSLFSCICFARIETFKYSYLWRRLILLDFDPSPLLAANLTNFWHLPALKKANVLNEWSLWCFKRFLLFEMLTHVSFTAAVNEIIVTMSQKKGSR